MENSTEIILYRIIQEFLNNIFKHASANEVLVQLIREDNRISITVEDSGKVLRNFDKVIPGLPDFLTGTLVGN